jgi:alkylation response protein AidB-like acyl-CoA dehydrogenase
MQASTHTLSDELLHQFAERCGTYDRENRFFHEDFDDLRRAGYLTMPVPKELGGAGLTLAEVCREQRRLAYYAPATALGINMHLYWVGLVADLWRQGDHSLEWLLKEAMAGEVFNAGHSERGNDLPLLLSTSKAERVDGGFRFTGHKMFASLAPVWTPMVCTRHGPMPRAGRRSCMPSCHAATTAGAWSRPGTRWGCARRAATT